MEKIKIYIMIWVAKNLYGYTKLSTKLFFAQAYHETGNFKSEVYKQNKNLFGMRHPKKRETFSQGSNLNHGVFKNHWDSIRDYFKRSKNFKLPNSDDFNFMEATVKSGYAEDKNYLPKWKNIYNSIKLPIDNRVIYGLLFFFLAIMVVKKLKRESKKPVMVQLKTIKS